MVLDYLVFNPVLARVQGCMLQCGTAKDVNIPTLIKVIGNELRNNSGALTALDDGTNVEGRKRQIFLFLLVNTQLDWKQDILENDNYSSCAFTCCLLQPSQLIDVVAAVNLWPYLFECCPFLPVTVLEPLLQQAAIFASKCESTSQKQKTGAHTTNSKTPLNPAGLELAVWTAVGTCSRFLQEKEQIIGDYLKAIFCPGLEEEQKFSNLISLLAVVKSYLSSPTSNATSTLYNFKRYSKESTEQENHKSIIEPLIVALKAFTYDLSVESWLEKIDSQQLIENNAISNIWMEENFPSNLQMITAHLMAQLAPLIEESGLENCADLLTVINSFAQPYNRQLELNLEELTLTELISCIKKTNVDNTAWKLDAYLDRVASHYLPEALADERFVDLLLHHPTRLSRHIKLIHKTLTDLPTVSANQKQLMLAVGRVCPNFDDLVALIQTNSGCNFSHVSTTPSKLQVDTYDLEFVDALNRASGDFADEAVQRNFLLLCVQNPALTVVKLVNEAAANAGQVTSIADILKCVDAACTVEMEEGVQFLPSLLATNILGKSGKEQENIIDLYLTMCKTNAVYANQVFMIIIKNIFTLVKNSKFRESVVLVRLCQSRLAAAETWSCANSDKSDDDWLSLSDARLSRTCLCWVLNQAYFGRTAAHLELRELTVCVIRQLNLRLDSNLVSLVHPDILSYFWTGQLDQRTVTVRDLVQYTYGKQSATACVGLESGYFSSEEIFAQLLSFLPFLLKAEFLPLFQVLLVLLGSEKDETTMTELKSLELVSDALQALVDTNIDEGEVEQMYLGYCSLYTSLIRTSETEQLLKLYRMIIEDMFFLYDNCNSGVSQTQQHQHRQLDVDAICAPLWASCQAAVAELLLKSPTVEQSKAVLVPLCMLPSNINKDTVVRLMQNYVDV